MSLRLTKTNLCGDDTKPWENGKMTFCQAYNTTCDQSPEEFCARGLDCEDADVAKSFDSELAELDRLSVTRISIGVGSHSDIEKGSGLDFIDNNPNKEFLPGLLPRQVLTSDDLTQVLRNLCLESTPSPTKSPSSQPTAVPTVTPTDYPTNTSPSNRPTKSPTDEPSVEPTTAEPSSSPTTPSPTNKPTPPPFGAGGFPGAPPGYTILSTPTTKVVGVSQPINANPIVIGEQNCLDVGFGMTNQYGTTVDYMFVQYKNRQNGIVVCEAFKNVSTDWFAEFSAHCMRSAEVSVVTITVVDSSFSVNHAASLPICCGDNEILGEIAGTAGDTKIPKFTDVLDCCPEEAT
jgi:hypothetical protein